MSDFIIISDSSCDLNAELRERFGIADYIPGIVIFPDGHTEYADLDWSRFTPEEYYGSMKDKKHLYKTAFANASEISDAFEKHLSVGKDILAVTLSSGLSGTYAAFCLAAKELEAKYPERRIRVVDSLKYSSAVGQLCVYASMMRDAGWSLDKTADWLDANKLRFHQMGVLDDLFFCLRMGRVSGMAALGGTLIGIKPFADFDRNGMSNAIGKTRGLKNSYRCIIEYMRRTIIDAEKQTIFIAHSVRPTEAAAIKELIEENFHPKEIITTVVGTSCGSGIGPGLFAAFYYGEEISEDMHKEKAILEEIIANK